MTFIFSSSSRRGLNSKLSSLFGALSMLTAAATNMKGSFALSTAATSSATNTNICNARYLGKSDLLVSESCLGTMTFGVQNSDEDAFEQLDYAMSRGCNFIDTAELYPVPLTSPDYRAGATEEILGRYIAKNMNGGKRREDLIIASKIAGFFPSSPVAAARSYPNEPISPPPDCRLDSSSIRNAVEASMRRLNTDYIDLYQIHWPDRYVPAFGMTTFQHTQVRDDDISILETASALKDMIDEGKIRYIGLSNESTFGVCQWINACEQLGIRDKLATIQNSYNLLDRRFDSELAEACHHYDIGLLPWSVLAGGLLSGKYNKRTMGDNVIKSTSNSRFVKFPEYMTRWNPKTTNTMTLDATEKYAEIASDAGLTPSQLAIGFVRSREFVKKNGSVILGATTMEQLKENLAPFENDIMLDEEVLARIDEVHLTSRDPCCSL